MKSSETDNQEGGVNVSDQGQPSSETQKDGGTKGRSVTIANEEDDALLYDEDLVDALPKKLRYTNLDLFCTLISAITYIFDLAMDIVVAVYFYHLAASHGIYHYWYFALTVAFILLPSLTMTGFSFRWYLMDADNQQLPPVSMWRWILRLIVLMLQIAPILRYFDSMRYGILSRWAAMKEKKQKDSEKKLEWHRRKVFYFTLMVYEDADATLLRLFECFMESAPQLVLQIYILIKDPDAIQLNEKQLLDDEVGDPLLKISILVVSIISSLISLAWSLVVYHRSLRYAHHDKKNIGWLGSLFQFLWHFFSITARVLALSLFAAIYPSWIFVVCACHWIVMSSWIVLQRTEACTTQCEEMLFALVLGAIYIFSFFNAKEERTRYKYLFYYSFCFCENTVCIALWAIFAREMISETLWYFYPSIIGHYVMFFGGIFFMVIYYLCFHPTGVEVDVKNVLNFSSQENENAKHINAKSMERPNFFDLQEIVSKEDEVEQEEERAQEMARKTKSAHVLDDMMGEEDEHDSSDNRSRRNIRRTSSVPADTSAIVITPSKRTFKDMKTNER